MCTLSSMYQFMCMCAPLCAYMCVCMYDSAKCLSPPQPTLGPPTSSLRPTWGKGASTAVSAVQEMSEQSDKEKDAGKHIQRLR